jgi:Ankyrin repeats (3 copies)/Ankyrin repeat
MINQIINYHIAPVIISFIAESGDDLINARHISRKWKSFVDEDCEEVWQNIVSNNLFFKAVKNGNEYITDKCSTYINPNIRETNNSMIYSTRNTPLHEASIRGNADITEILLKKGADVNIIDSGGLTPLRATLLYRREYNNSKNNVVRLLLEYGAIKDTKNEKGNTPLHEATMVGNINAIKLLLEDGIDVDATNNDGRTALHLAAIYEYDDIIQLLLDYGADKDSRCNFKCKPWMTASGYLKKSTMRSLRSYHIAQKYY